MSFCEPAFLFYFLPLVLCLHAILRGEARNVMLLLTSLIFYAWGEPAHILLLLVSIGVNHLLASAISKAQTKRLASNLFITGLTCNLAALAFFKYRLFIIEVIRGHSNPDLEQVFSLPLGISFFTLQGIAYLFDVKRGDIKAETRWWRTALFISLFPQLIAGPILRFKSVVRQLDKRAVGINGFAHGMRRFIIGLGKKVLIADQLRQVSDSVFSITDPASPLQIQESLLAADIAWLGIACFSLQLYFDFSGYSDMAIGIGRMFGLRIPENFNYPHLSRSISEFWRRWHISLSTWLRDYVFIPLGGSRRSSWRTVINLWIVFLLCGLWHGASWNFVCMGASYGLVLSVEKVLAHNSRKKHVSPGIIYANIAWLFPLVFLRSADLRGSIRFLRALCFQETGNLRIFNPTNLTGNNIMLALFVSIIGVTPIFPFITRKSRRLAPSYQSAIATLRDFFLLGVLFISALSIAYNSLNSFWYFRF